MSHKLLKGVLFGLVFAVIIWFAANEQKAPTPVVRAYTDCVTYPSVTDAVRSAVERSFDLNQTYEMGGIIYKNGKGFCFTEPVTSNQKHRVSILIPGELRSSMVAIYHTHTDEFYNEYAQLFSSTDVHTSIKLQIPSYIGIRYTGDIKRFKPTDEPITRGGAMFGEGEVVTTFRID